LFRLPAGSLFALLMTLCAAIAGPEASGEKDAETKAERQLRQVIFSSVEYANGSAYIGSGFKHAFGKSIDEQGFVFMSLSGAGATPEIFEGPGDFRIRVARLSNSASMMLGYQWIAPGRVLMLAIGPETTRSQEIDASGRPRWLPRRTGVKAIAEIWHEPRPRMMVQATGIFSSGRSSLWSRAAAGFALRDGLFLGPEATAYLERDYREARIGMHLTGLSIGRFQLRLNAGISGIAGQKGGYYVGLAGHFKR
jgi:hypothetical protein